MWWFLRDISDPGRVGLKPLPKNLGGHGWPERSAQGYARSVFWEGVLNLPLPISKRLGPIQRPYPNPSTTKLPNKNLIEQLGVPLTFGSLHQRPHKPTQHLLLLLRVSFLLILSNLIRHPSQNLIHHLLQSTGIRNLLQALSFNNGIRIIRIPIPKRFKYLLGSRGRHSVIGNTRHQLAQLRASDRRLNHGFVLGIQTRRKLTQHPVGGQLGIFTLTYSLFKKGCNPGVVAEQASIIIVEAILLLESSLALIGQFRQQIAGAFNKRIVDYNGQQVRAGEVTVIVGFLFAAHRSGFVAIAVIKTGLLNNTTAIFQNIHLPLYFMGNGLLHKTERVQVLGFCASAQLIRAFRFERDVHIETQGALTHITVTNAD